MAHAPIFDEQSEEPLRQLIYRVPGVDHAKLIKEMIEACRHRETKVALHALDCIIRLIPTIPEAVFWGMDDLLQCLAGHLRHPDICVRMHVYFLLQEYV